jgi:hypothetical protein
MKRPIWVFLAASALLAASQAGAEDCGQLHAAIEYCQHDLAAAGRAKLQALDPDDKYGLLHPKP